MPAQCESCARSRREECRQEVVFALKELVTGEEEDCHVDAQVSKMGLLEMSLVYRRQAV